MHNNKEKDRKDDKEEEEDKDDNGSIVPPLENHYKQQYSDSDSDSENKQRDRVDLKEAPVIDLIKFTLGFLSGKNGIFGDSNEKDNNQIPKKTRKTGRSLSSRINGIFTNNADDPGEVTNNVTNSNINPTHR